MPTILSYEGFAIRVYTNDHPPPHVHVIRDKNEAVFLLNCPSGVPELRENFGFAKHDCRAIQRVLLNNLTVLCSAWEALHGDF